jgi:hypothetical protein
VKQRGARGLGGGAGGRQTVAIDGELLADGEADGVELV